MPVRINEKKRTSFASEHLIPLLVNPPSPDFISAKTGKTYSRGMVVYLGKSVTPEMMLERYCQVASPAIDSQAALRVLAAYCDALQNVKIGNLISVSYSPAGLPLLKVEQEVFQAETERKLP